MRRELHRSYPRSSMAHLWWVASCETAVFLHTARCIQPHTVGFLSFVSWQQGHARDAAGPVFLLSRPGQNAYLRAWVFGGRSHGFCQLVGAASAASVSVCACPCCPNSHNTCVMSPVLYHFLGSSLRCKNYPRRSKAVTARPCLRRRTDDTRAQ